jgi:hypothetical protein
LLHFKASGRATHSGRVNGEGVGDAKTKANVTQKNLMELGERSTWSARAIGENNILARFKIGDFARLNRLKLNCVPIHILIVCEGGEVGGIVVVPLYDSALARCQLCAHLLEIDYIVNVCAIVNGCMKGTYSSVLVNAERVE